MIGSCSNSKIRQRFNLDYVAPNEFEVQKQKELEIPTKFSLPRPEQGQEKEAKEVIQETKHENLSKSDREFLDKVGN